MTRPPAGPRRPRSAEATFPRGGHRVGDENPTHYGPPSNIGGTCKSDEWDLNWGVQPGGPDEVYICKGGPDLGCQQDSDCPTDVPPSTGATPACRTYQITSGNVNLCELSCKADKDCPLGSFCFSPYPDGQYLQCAYRQSTDCYYIANVRGSWVSVGSSSGKQSVSVQEGVTRSHEVSDSSAWGGSVTTSVSAGFKFFGADSSVSVSGTASHDISHSYSSTFSKTTTTTYTYDFDAGVVWQWQFNVADGCGPTLASGHDYALTLNKANPPCCLPGFFMDPKTPHGDCVEGTANICTGLVED